MTHEELAYMERALEALKSAEHTEMAKCKILRTLSQIAARAAQEIENNLVDQVEAQLYNQATETAN